MEFSSIPWRKVNLSTSGRNSSLVLGHLESTSVRHLALLSWTQALCVSKMEVPSQAVDVCVGKSQHARLALKIMDNFSVISSDDRAEITEVKT